MCSLTAFHNGMCASVRAFVPQESIPEEAGITLAELKSRPQGKAQLTDRSCLHDDITCVIVHFQTDPEMESGTCAARSRKERFCELFFLCRRSVH